MKHILSYNESIVDQMKPKSDEYIKKIIKDKTGYEKLRLSKKYNISISDDEFNEILLNILSERPSLIFDAVNLNYNKGGFIVYSFDELKNILSKDELKNGLINYTKSLLIRIGADNDNNYKINEFVKSLYYLFDKGYRFDNIDNTGTIWFDHVNIDKYNGGNVTLGKYTTFDDVKNYVERMEKLRNEK